MATYDPKRTRRGPSADAAPDDATQVDAILDRTSDGEIPAVPGGTGAEVPAAVVPPVEPAAAPQDEPAAAHEVAEEPAVEVEPEAEAPRAAPPASGRVEAVPPPAPERSLQRVAVVTGIAAATAAAIWLLRRRRDG